MFKNLNFRGAGAATITMAALLVGPLANAQSFNVLHNFTRSTEGGYPISANLKIDALGLGIEVSNMAIEVGTLGIRLQQIEVGLEGNTFVLIRGSVAELNAKNGLMAIVRYLRQRRGSNRHHWEQF